MELLSFCSTTYFKESIVTFLMINEQDYALRSVTRGGGGRGVHRAGQSKQVKISQFVDIGFPSFKRETRLTLKL